MKDDGATSWPSDQGGADGSQELAPLVYEELRRLAAAQLAHENPEHSLQPTDLVHEAYLRLTGKDGSPKWESRAHFFAAAAEAMRRILIDNARKRKAAKRGGELKKLSLLDEPPVPPADPDLLLSLDEALDRLAEADPDLVRIVKFRFYGGLSIDQAAQLIGISRAHAYRQLTFAMAWLVDELGGGP
jgi:RNA polymerase sigma factor (TIGR02999 family)